VSFPEILSPDLHLDPSALKRAITDAYLRDENECVNELIALADVGPELSATIHTTAVGLVERVRAKKNDQSAVESFMREYDLSSEEGVLLMCVAEALLRIPDAETADELIRDKLGDADWARHLGKSDSLFVNAGTYGLLLTGKLVNLADDTMRNVGGALKRLVGRSGEPVIRLAVRQAMKIMGHQFVMGRTIQEALKRAQEREHRAYRYSYDMLGESALTTADALRYHEAYRQAILAIGASGPHGDVFAAPSISVKLSALHPRYEVANRARVMRELTPRVLELAQLARAQAIGFCVDAEEAERLELSLDIIEQVYSDPTLAGWEGFGLALQAYQKRAIKVIDWLADVVKRVGRRMPLRLVKGAYWDSEIKRAQIDGLSGYPVFTRKPSTDVSYLACAKKLLAAREQFYPMFATHNAHTIAAIVHVAGARSDFEFQRLHGMGQQLYAEVIGQHNLNVACRVYAPVGSHEDLLPYLVRRLLENGANTSFVNRIVDERLSADELVTDPVGLMKKTEPKRHPKIPLPRLLYGADRTNSRGVNHGSVAELAQLAAQINASPKTYRAGPLVPGATLTGATHSVTDPADRRRALGEWQAADAATIERALTNAVAAQPRWDATPVDERAACLERAAVAIEARRGEFIALLTREAGKTFSDTIAEVREAADFCRYYAAQARREFGEGTLLPGPTGESNRLSLHGKGVFVCISPWNFPLAIYLGQVAAALVAGNSVIAKPAEQTTLVGHLATQMLHGAGVPTEVLQFVPGIGREIGPLLTSDARVAGVAFTGSTETARGINRALAAREAAIATLIAETGGQNALLADSSSLPEQVVKDAISSAFGSAGQRCSACRVLIVQADIAERVIELLKGAMNELVIGDPARYLTDLGPVIDDRARAGLAAHVEKMRASVLHQLPLEDRHAHGSFFPPTLIEISSLKQLEREVFGPVLHVLRYAPKDLDAVLAAINATGYGLTLGIHSRIDSTIDKISRTVRAGNHYVNRNMIGAVVGVQPFGGEGLSGTGPKAGGPHYLLRFASERTVTVNTAAVGGNATLLALAE
jgi:RHH-type transcriptional regulator, proline utilization regulon repressor / proline dehydrogenase / delta 1-pyrroline-5-carboxylate dehydrogenase